MKKQIRDELRSIRYAISESGLPALTGGAQEIEWANTIRIDRLMEANNIVARLHQMLPEGENSQANLEDAILASRRLRESTPAAWWIASRNTEMEMLLQQLAHRSYAMESGRN
jgi:hypothetical protein